jgi:hypothetical protein
MEIGEYGPYASADIPTFNSPDPMRLYYYDIQSSTTANLIMNGNPLSTTVSGNLFLTSFAQPELGRRYGGAVYHDFNLSEMVVFSPALNTSQRQQVEGYLAHKWGLSQTYATNTPLSIPGCQLWLDGADSSSLVLSGSNVTQWNDKSGNGFNGTVVNASVGNPIAPSYVTNSINGLSAVTMSGTSYFTGSTNVNSTTLTAFFIGNCVFGTGGSSQQRILGLSIPGSDDYSSTLRPIPLSVISGGTQLLAYRNANMASATVVSGTNFIGCCLFDGTSNYMYKDGTLGTQVSSSGTFTTSIYGVGSDAGTQFMGGTSSLGTNCLVGKIGEMILFNTALITPQRQQVESYLAQKWGLRQQLPQGHPGTRGIVYPLQAIPTAIYWRYQNIFTPLQIQPGNCQLWLDAYDSSSVTVSGTNIISVQDKSGKGVVLSNATGYSYPNNTFNGSYPSFLPSNVSIVNGTQTLGVNTSFAVATPFTVVFVAKRVLSSDTAAAFIIDSGGSSGANRPYIWDPTGAFTWNVATSTTTSAISLTSSVVVTELGTSPTFFENGTNALVSPSSTNFTTGGITIGNRYTLNNGFPGHICEIIIYSNSLTTTQRQQVEGYLAWKWGLQASLPANHPYKNSSPSTTNPGGVSRPANVLPIPPITLYASRKPPAIMATALSYLPLLTNSTDVGSTPRTVTTNGSVTYTTIANKQSAYFNNSFSNYLSLPYTPQTQLTLCFWLYVLGSGEYTAVSINNGALNPTLQVDLFGNSTTTTIFTAMPNQWANQPSGNYGGPGQWAHFAITLNYSTYFEQLYINGISVATATGSGSPSIPQSQIWLGRSGDTGRAYDGYIRQFCTFPSVLTQAQIQSIITFTT